MVLFSSRILNKQLIFTILEGHRDKEKIVP
jgi:hypothetical protein